MKFKYGPLGSTVNVASRIEKLAKILGVPAIIGGQTIAKASPAFLTRPLTSARVAGINEPVQLFELLGSDSPSLRRLCSEYEKALGLFRSHKLEEAIEELDRLLAMFPQDGPSQLLRSRALMAKDTPEADFKVDWTPGQL